MGTETLGIRVVFSFMYKRTTKRVKVRFAMYEMLVSHGRLRYVFCYETRVSDERFLGSFCYDMCVLHEMSVWREIRFVLREMCLILHTKY